MLVVSNADADADGFYKRDGKFNSKPQYIKINADGTVFEFNEKPQATGGRISGGFFVLNRAIFNYLPADTGLVFEEQPLRALVAAGELMVHEHDGFWQCMDTYRDFKLLTSLWETGNAPWRNWA